MNQDITQLVWDLMLVNEVNLYFQLIDRKIFPTITWIIGLSPLCVLMLG